MAGRVVEALGVTPGDADALLAVTTDDILGAVPGFNEGTASSAVPTGRRRCRALPQPPLDAIAAGNAAGVHVLTGTNGQEMTLFLAGDPQLATMTTR